MFYVWSCVLKFFFFSFLVSRINRHFTLVIIHYWSRICKTFLEISWNLNCLFILRLSFISLTNCVDIIKSLHSARWIFSHVYKRWQRQYFTAKKTSSFIFNVIGKVWTSTSNQQHRIVVIKAASLSIYSKAYFLHMPLVYCSAYRAILLEAESYESLKAAFLFQVLIWDIES